MTLQHGGALDAAIAEYGGRREEWLDLSTGINPLAWPVPAIDQRYFSRLPEGIDHDLAVSAARKAYGVADRMAVVAVAGTQSPIEILPRMLPGGTASVLCGQYGTYGEHAHCCAKAGRKVRECADPGEVGPGESLAVLVHPNNPDGRLWDGVKVRQLAARLAGAGGHVIVDEAFCDCTPAQSFVRGQPDNAIILRSFGKFFGLAGIRLGFVICTAEIAEQIRGWLGPWPVAGPALAVAAPALSDREWIENSREWQKSQSAILEKLLVQFGLEIVGRHPLFILVCHERAGELATRMAERQIAVRQFPDRPLLLRFGLPADDKALARLGQALAAWMEPVAS